MTLLVKNDWQKWNDGKGDDTLVSNKPKSWLSNDIVIARVFYLFPVYLEITIKPLFKFL